MISTNNAQLNGQLDTYMFCGNLTDTKKLRLMIKRNNQYSVDHDIGIEDNIMSFYILSEKYIKDNQKIDLICMLKKSVFKTESVMTINSYGNMLRTHDKKFSMRIISKNNKISLSVRSNLPESIHTKLLFKLLNNNDTKFAKRNYKIIASSSNITSLCNNKVDDDCKYTVDSDSDSEDNTPNKKQKTK